MKLYQVLKIQKNILIIMLLAHLKLLEAAKRKIKKVNLCGFIFCAMGSPKIFLLQKMMKLI